MIRRLLPTTWLLAATAVVALAARPATLVLNNGERVSGELTYNNGNDVMLNGRAYPFNDIAIIAFQAGDPPAAELQQLPRNANPAELNRHMFVMTDGSIVHGKLYNISADGQTISFDPRGSGAAGRRDVPASQVARIYINPQNARSVYNNLLNQPAAVAAPPTPVATTGVAAPPPGSITINGNQAWTDTGVTVKKGDHVAFSSTGQVMIATGGSAESAAGPDGAGGVAAGPGKPVPQMATGGLIGRVGNGVPFPIGGNSQPITMPANGRLFLGINDDNLSDNSGAFYVIVSKR
jgi:hypothetical protein